MEKPNKIYDVAVIGGGAAGMMAAGRAGELGASVILIERNKSLGKKIAITGKGRCNVAQAEFEVRNLIKEFGNNGKFLFSALNSFGPQQTVDFFESKGLKLKIERGGRIFPESDDAADVIQILKKYLFDNKVKVLLDAQVTNIEKSGNKITRIKLSKGQITAKKIIICTGGKSYPSTGSSGDGFIWAKRLGHNVVADRPALVPLKIENAWVKKLKGLSLKNVELSALQDGKKRETRFGEMLFTHFGVSGPIVLDISMSVGELLEKGKVKLSLDLKPALSDDQLDERILRDFKKYSNKLFKNSLDDLLPQKLIAPIVEMSGIDADKQVNAISREERKGLVLLLKNLEMTVGALMGYELAVVTAGGVNLKEIDPQTMRSKVVENLYFAGEILDLAGPTGGYNLQVAWSTGFVAGENSVNI